MTDDLDPKALKAALREKARKARVAQPDKDALSTVILGKVLTSGEYARAKVVMFYVEAGSEVRTRHAIPAALDAGKTVVVPWCVVETNTLELFRLTDVSELVEGAYRILEPRTDLRDLPDRRVRPDELDLVLVPGTAFDRSGGRMGQGKGYYDRLLEHARPDAPLVALAFDCQIVDAVPTDAHDVFMDKVVTESAEYTGRGRER